MSRPEETPFRKGFDEPLSLRTRPRPIVAPVSAVLSDRLRPVRRHSKSLMRGPYTRSGDA